MNTSKIAYFESGFRGLVSHFVGRVFGKPRFLNSASSVDFRNSNLKSFRTIADLLAHLLPEKNSIEITSSLSLATSLLNGIDADYTNYDFPDRWNAGVGLQRFMCSLILLTKPSKVIETGTANGASALAISLGLSQNNFGHLWSFDIKKSSAKLVPVDLRSFVSFVNFSGSNPELRKILSEIHAAPEMSIFLHDSDHSYAGQISDYKTAIDFNFEFLISDDIDASLAFCDFTENAGSYFYDEPKFIGAIRNLKE